MPQCPVVLRFLLAAATAVALALAPVGSSVSNVSADYGPNSVYQVEISYNCTGPTACIPGVVQGIGVWLWIGLNADGTGDYAGSDCGHVGSLGPAPGGSGAFSDRGDVTWTSDGTTITINGVSLLGGEIQPVIHVPAKFGHYQETALQLFSFPLPGWSQVQVAP